nr:MAG TPA: helicase [Caudoviricetes sp.]
MAKCIRCGKSGIFLKVNNEGLCDSCNEQQTMYLRKQIAELSNPEYQNLEFLRNKISECQYTFQNLQQQVAVVNQELQNIQNQKQEIQKEIVDLSDDVLVQSFGLYNPKYDFANSSQYKDRLSKIRSQQKELIKSGLAATGNMDWTVNGSRAQGKKMVKDMQKLLLRAFNSECDDIVERVKYNNYEASIKRITSSMEAISKLGQIMSVSITPTYYNLKIQELDLAFEYRQIKQQEKEEQKELRAQMREEAKLQKEIEEERKKLQKEQKHYQNALEKLEEQLLKDPENPDLLQKKAELMGKIGDTQKAIADVDYREANKKAGYVYVISNIGAFGENVFKIGMTRRLDPTERVDELGDASVPFNFDIHAMIFSEDAPKLEAALHQAFADRKLNMVNTRREFFNVTLDEIKNVVAKNFDRTVEFIDVAEAEQFRVSQKIKNQNK